MKKTIDINCDLGEGVGIEADMMPYISSANIACGYHAGDAETIQKTIALCMEHDVAIGAHPSFEDRSDFGRTEMHLSDEDITDLLIRQIDIMMKAAQSVSGSVRHVKPHGALYNMAARDAHLAFVICQAIRQVDPSLILFGLSGSALITEGKKAGLRVMNEVFADRTYQSDGSLTPRSLPGALITDIHTSVQHSWQMIRYGTVTTLSGEVIPVEADTICIHGDGAYAIDLARALHQKLDAEGIRIRHPAAS